MLTGYATTATKNVATSSLLVFGTQLVKSPSADHGKGGHRDLLAHHVSFVNQNLHNTGINLVPIAAVDGEGWLVTRGRDLWKIKTTCPTLSENTRLFLRLWVGMTWWLIKEILGTRPSNRHHDLSVTGI